MKGLMKIFILISIWLTICGFNNPTRVSSSDILNLDTSNSSAGVKKYDVHPVNSDANLRTKKLLAYFYALRNKKKSAKKRIISGQFIGIATSKLLENYSLNIISLKNKTGKNPAIFGIDYGWEKINLEKIISANKLLIEHSNLGGIVTVNFSLSNPWTREGLNDLGYGKYKFKDLFQKGSIPNKNFISDLEIIASGLKDLEDNNVTVLIRPFQEMNGDWFWWSGEKENRFSPEQFRDLWLYVFNYFTYTRHLNNLLWLYSPQYNFDGGNILPMTYYYPGDKYVDIVGFSYYQGQINVGKGYYKLGKSYEELLELGKPVGLAEFGPNNSEAIFGEFDNAQLLEAVKNRYPELVYFMYWSGWNSFGLRLKKAIIENKNARLLMNDPLVITREDLKK